MDTADRMFKELLDAMSGSPAQTGQERLHTALRNLAACYRKAQKDGQAKIPSYLESAIATVIAGTATDPFNPYSERRTEPRYQERSDGGGDMSPRGGQLKPGT